MGDVRNLRAYDTAQLRRRTARTGTHRAGRDRRAAACARRMPLGRRPDPREPRAVPRRGVLGAHRRDRDRRSRRDDRGARRRALPGAVPRRHRGPHARRGLRHRRRRPSHDGEDGVAASACLRRSRGAHRRRRRRVLGRPEGRRETAPHERARRGAARHAGARPGAEDARQGREGERDGRRMSRRRCDCRAPPAPPATEPELGRLLLELVESARSQGLDAERALRGAVRDLEDQVRRAEQASSVEA